MISKSTFHFWSRIFWVLLLLGAGLSHFVLDDFLLAQMPPYMPHPTMLIYLSGVAELILAAGLIYPATRGVSWYMIAAMCVVYLPVHWHVAIDCAALAEVNSGYHIPCWLAWLRLPIQLLFIIWALYMAPASAK